MGQVKQMMLEENDYDLGYIKDTFVCSNHIDDYAIREFIKKSDAKEKCSYCNKKRKVVSFRDLMEEILFGVRFQYEDAANWMSYDSREGGYLGNTYTNYELIEQLLEIDNYNLQEDISNGIADIVWSSRYDYWSTEGELLEDNWSLFKDVVKHKNRYLFTKSNKFKTEEDNRHPFDIFQDISDSVKPLNLLNRISVNDELYRVRQHELITDVKSFVDIASTPKDKSIYSNRMSPAGISMFYGSFDKDTSAKETIDRNNENAKYISTGIFKTKKEINVIDFSKLEYVSIFDRGKQQYYYISQFLNLFINDLAKKIEKDGKEHIEYVPTQIVTEYFRYPFSEELDVKIDGVIYPSSKNVGKKAFVLFFDAEECIAELDLITIKTSKIV